ncbi:hypothetical protein CCP3SC15_420011 [Gammaproteobacteria bacterium]
MAKKTRYNEEHKPVSLRLITYKRVEQFQTGPDKSFDGTITRICDLAGVPVPKE